jgi:hypothetical protein
MGSGKLYC